MRIPKYRKHSKGQARVTIRGRDFLLGEYGSPESIEAYKAKVAELLATSAEAVIASESEITLSELALAYLDHAKIYYADGSEYKQLLLTVRPISELYSHLPASQFGPKEFKAVRHWWLTRKVPHSKPERTCSRQYVNKQMKRLIRVIRWAVGEGMIPAAVHQTLKCIDPLKKGRVDAPECKPIKPVDPKLLEATLEHLPPVLVDMIRFQLHTGCRPGEVCSLKPSMVDRSKPVWEIELEEHKTAYRGKQRTIYVGPQAQKVIRPYLDRDSEAFCFSPQEALKQRRASRVRNTPLSQGNRPGYSTLVRSGARPEKQAGESYTTASYGRAIKYACEKAKLAPWAPNQIRHLTATEIRKQFGLAAASLILGHSGLEVTQVYAEADREKAIKVAQIVG